MKLSQISVLTVLPLLGQINALTQLPVCVVGGGPGGITMGRKLKANNIEHRVFEAESRVGGKAYTWYDNQFNRVEMGAFFFTKRQERIVKAIQDVGLELEWFNGSSIEVYNQSGNLTKLADPTTEDKAKFVDAVKRFNELRDSYNLKAGYVNVPAEAQVSISQWLTNNKLDILRTFFIPNFAIQGYGSLEDISAIYMLKAFNLKGLSSLNDLGYALWSVKGGLDNLWKKLSQDLNLSLNHKVTRIDRTEIINGKRIVKLHFDNNSIKPVSCSHVVIAFPPYISKIRSIFTDFDSEEQIISKIRNHYYGTTVIETQGSGWQSNAIFDILSSDLTIPTEPAGKSETVGFLKQGKYYSAYSWKRGSFYGPVPLAVQDEFKIEQMKLLNKLDNNKGGSSRSLFHKSFAYFPNVAPKDVQQGFFAKFDALQGRKNTFYVTSATSFETMNEVMDSSEYIFENKLLPLFKS